METVVSNKARNTSGKCTAKSEVSNLPLYDLEILLQTSVT
jgi:hypothetical protein